MATGVRGLFRVRTIRTRILLIGWVPSVALLLVGVAIAGYLGFQAADAASDAKTIGNGSGGARDLVLALENELPASAAVITDPTRARTALEAQRAQTDQIAQQYAKSFRDIGDAAPPEFTATNVLLGGAFGQLTDIRARVDAGNLSLIEVSQYYGGVIRLVGAASADLGRSAPDGPTALEEAAIGSLYEISSEMIQGNALAYAAFSNAGMNELQYQEFVRTAGVYRERLDFLARELPPVTKNQLFEFMSGPAWQQQAEVEQAVLRSKVPTDQPRPGTARKAELPITEAKWEAAATKVSAGLADLSLTQTRYGADLARDKATSQLTEALVAGGLLIGFAIFVLLLTTRASNQLIARLRDLRQQTLDLAQTRLPNMVARIRAGEKIDAVQELPSLELGQDEIGQVASAFNDAQRVAVAATVQEAETRAGLRAVFLNIAYRSQVIVHRQLGVLERAERFQEDPDQLKLLFELDHLATRSRRNAENLVILGGGQPGRRWRNPVSLIQVVRGAISEAQDYARVSTTPLPGLSIRGAAVADVIHLLAELVDNATAFSPPMSRVEVRANLVGRGLVIEVEDQGLGIPAEQLIEFNEMLSNPPDFHVMALSEEPRLGMFVVAQLARSQGIRVTLTPSPAYGGTKAVILLPNEVIDTSEMVEHSLTAAVSPVTTRRLSPVVDRPALAYSRTASEDGWSDPARSGDSLHERMAIVEEEQESGAGGWPAPAEDPAVRPGSAPALARIPSGPPANSPPASGPPANSPPANSPLTNSPLTGGQPANRPLVNRPLRNRPLPNGPASIETPAGGTIPIDTPPNGTIINGRATGRRTDNSPTTLPPGLPLGAIGTARPELPRRNRQAHLDERLLTPSAGTSRREPVTNPVPDPELARHRMAAFQRGTRQARTQNPEEQS
jgi:signal transduction histidine kinase